MDSPHTANQAFVIERFFSCTFALAVVLLLEPKYVIHSFIVLGHAHFVLTYIYQGLAGKIKLWHMIPYIIVLLLSFFLAGTYPFEFMIFATTFFLFHNFYDDFKLLNRLPHVVYFPLILSIVIILSSWLVDDIWRLDIARYAVMGGSIIGGVMLVFWLWFRKALNLKPQPYAIFLLGFLGVLAGLEFTSQRPSSIEGIGFVIIMHCMAWYINLGRKFYNHGEGRFKGYLFRVLVVNILFISGYFALYASTGISGHFYAVIYSLSAFHVWSLMHLLTTLRASDFSSSFKLTDFLSVGSIRS